MGTIDGSEYRGSVEGVGNVHGTVHGRRLLCDVDDAAPVFRAER